MYHISNQEQKIPRYFVCVYWGDPYKDYMLRVVDSKYNIVQCHKGFTAFTGTTLPMKEINTTNPYVITFTGVSVEAFLNFKKGMPLNEIFEQVSQKIPQLKFIMVSDDITETINELKMMELTNQLE